MILTTSVYRLCAICILSIGVYSCHFYDDRVTAVNSFDEPMYFSIWEAKPSGREDLISPFFLVESGQERSITLDQNMRFEHLSVDSVTILVTTEQAHDAVRNPSGYYAFEKLLGTSDITTLLVAKSEVLEAIEVHLEKGKTLILR